MKNAGSIASGLVSIAVTKMAAGVAPGAGMRLNGRVRSVVHRPEAMRLARTAWASSVSSSAARQDLNDSASSPSSRMTTDCNARRAPRLMAMTSPAPGAVNGTSGLRLS